MTTAKNYLISPEPGAPRPTIVEELGPVQVLPFSKAPASFDAVQKRSRHYCESNPLPSAREEMWRYTKPEQFNWKQIQGTQSSPLSLEIFGDSTRPGEATLLRNSDSPIDGFETKQLFFQSNPAIDSLQLAYASDIDTLSITASQPKDAPLLLSRLISSSSSPVLYIEVKAGVHCTIIEDLDSKSDDLLYLPKTHFILGAGSSLEFVSLQRLNDHSQHYGRFTFFLDRDARLSSLFLSLGAHVSRTDIECVVAGPGAHAQIGCLYLTDQKRHVDFHTEQQHSAPHCYSNLQCKGALRDEARGVYFGFIRVAEGSQKTDAYQKAKTMLLSKNARADNIPNLEIKANDVKCSHGASVSPVGGEELFYLKSRGISQQAAEILLLQGFFEDTLQRISNKNIQEYCMTRVMERL